MNSYQQLIKKILNSKILYIGILLFIEVCAVHSYIPTLITGDVNSDFSRLVLGVTVIAGIVISAKFFKKNLFVTAAIFWLSLLYAFVFNILLNIEILTSLQQLPNALMITSGLLMIIYATLGRYQVIFWIPILFTLSIVAIAYHEYDILITPVILSQILNATVNEAATYLTVRNICWLFSLLAILGTIFWILHRIYRKESRLSMLYTGILLIIVCLLSRSYLHPLRNNTACGLWPIKSLQSIANNTIIGNKQSIQQVAAIQALKSPADDPSDSTILQGNEGIVIIFHLGESVRADHLGINGYHRNTTPNLSNAKNIVNFRDCSAAAGLTEYAIPVILTNARRGRNINSNPAYEATRSSFIDLLDKHDIDCYAYMPRDFFGEGSIPRMMSKLLNKCREIYPAADLYSYTDEYNTIANITAKQGSRNQFIFINNTGSHFPFWLYNQDNPPFTPTSPSAYGNSPAKNPDEAEKALNAYDNTIHYLDDCINKTLQLLQGKPYLYIYISDHAESVGEQGDWSRSFSLHESTFHARKGSLVPFFILYSDELLQYPHFKKVINNLHANKNLRTAQEHIYHTMLGLVGIQAASHNPNLDLTSPSVLPYAGPHPDDYKEKE